MHKRFLLAASALAILAGCGGGGGTSVTGGGGPIPAPEAAPFGSAKFTVDARTGEVKVESISASRAAFSGGALSFTSSLLLSEGSPERRIIRVTAKNNTQEIIGADGSMKLLFTNFQNANTPLTDLRSLVQTSTIWGNGTATTTFGGQTTATIQSPRAIHFDEATETLFATDGIGQVLTAKGGTISRNSTAAGNTGGITSGPGFVLESQPSQIIIKLDGLPIVGLTGGAPGNIDGDFAAARFTALNDIFMIRATGPNDFEAVIADGNRLRLVRRTPSFPNGSVSTLTISVNPIRGVTFKDGVYSFTSGNFVFFFANSQTGTIGDTASGYVDGIQTSARFNAPAGIRWVGSSLFVADTFNNRVRQLNLRPGGNVFTPNNWWVSTVSGNSTFSSVDGTGAFMTHANPFGLAKGPGETLFVSDQAGHRIRRITPISNRFLDNFGDSTANPTEPVQLANATDYVPSAPTRTPLIIENQSIPSGGTVTLGDWQFNLPEGVKSFSFIVTVEASTLAPGVLPSVSNTGSGTKGSTLVSLRTLAGAVGPGTANGSSAVAAFSSLQSICVTNAGDIFAADFNNFAIRRISKGGIVTTILGPNAAVSTVDGVWPTSSSGAPLAIACSPDGSKVFFSQSDRVIRVLEFLGGDAGQPHNWKVTTIAGAVNSPGAIFGTTGDLARFDSVRGLAYIDPQTLVATDSFNHCVLTIEKRGTGASSADYYVRVLAGLTIPGYVDGQGSVARFNNPAGISLSKSGFLFVADQSNRRIRRLDLGGSVTTFSGSGLNGTQDASSPQGASFAEPFGIATEPSGYLYVTDLGGRNIRRLSPTGVVSTVAGTANVPGTADGTGNTGTFNFPVGIAVGPGGDVFVTDSNRIRLLQRIITN
jgi:hypothetical protein